MSISPFVLQSGQSPLTKQAAQPAPPKQFTDEELKQQYGIHLATRLQADGEGNEAKWADIDDDDSDWAPDTIKWNDGTTITLAPAENAPTPVQESSTVSSAKDDQIDVKRGNAFVPKQSFPVGSNATVLKLSSSANTQPKFGGLVLKGPSDKPMLVAKPSVPTPVKSPWASLPPVEKVPPIPINPPSQQSSVPKFGQRDLHGFDSMPPPPSPAKEIAADDFNRSWRDHHAGNTRELFNSQSGRYEPVNNARRGSVRAEQNFRPPSLLQRPLNSDQQGPAEPSAAFQTHRTNTHQDASTWNRRRTSSNVSGESGSYGRRMSFSKGQELPSIPSEIHEQRHGSQRSGASDRVTSPRSATASVNDQPQHYPTRRLSPAQLQQESSQPTVKAVEQVPLNGSANTTQDPITMQKQLMRERRELAIKRRQEQEQRDEAEKKERIRVKMEALGLPPLDESKGKRENQDKQEKLETMEKPKEATTVDGQAANGVIASTMSPPKPPVPEVSGEPKQYGMMKVHHPQTVKKISSVKEPAADSASEVSGPNHQISPPQQDANSEIKNNTQSARRDGVNSAAQIAPPPRTGERDPKSLPEDRMEKSWKNVPSGSETYTSWSGSSMTTHSAPGESLWGPPGSDKALGNGTFDGNLARLPQRQAPHSQHVHPPAPGPIGPRVAAGATISTHAVGATSDQSREDVQTVVVFPPPEQRKSSRPEDQIRAQVRGRDTKHGREVRSPRSIAPPTSSAIAPRQAHALGSTAALTSGWKNFALTAAREEAEERDRHTRERVARLEEEARTGIKQESPMPPISDTWIQTGIDKTSGQRNTMSVERESKMPPISETSGQRKTMSVKQESKVPRASDTWIQTGIDETTGQRKKMSVKQESKMPLISESSKAALTSGWNNFHLIAAREEAEKRDRDTRERVARLEEEARTGIKQESKIPPTGDTWIQTGIDETSGQRKKMTGSKTLTSDPALGDRQQGLQTGGSPPFDNVVSAPMATPIVSSATGSARGSKFFPQLVDGAPTPSRRSASYSPGFTRSPSPPPPDSFEHPAYAGDVNRPTVSLPFVKPKPTVKLPPTVLAPIAPPSVSPMPTPTQPLRVVSQPLVNTATWQDRFNGLFGRKASPEKKFALAVNSATKVPLDVSLPQASAAVSLPRSEDGDNANTVLEDGITTSKAMEDEEALFEEREFGSLPTVRIPRMAPPAVWAPAKAPLTHRPKSKMYKPTEVTSIEPFVWNLWDKENERPEGYVVSVRLPGDDFAKAKIMAQNHNSLHNRGPRNTAYKQRKGMKPRDNPGHLGPGKVAGNHTPIPAAANNNHRPTHQGGSWARRVAGVVR